MKIEADSPEEYINKLPEDRKFAVENIRKIIRKNLPDGFEETMSYGMIGYVVPHSIFPDGYHCDPGLPLPFINLASQKNYIALYHSGIYAKNDLAEWFKEEYKKIIGKKPDMGKSCIRFKDPEKIPYNLIGELCTKMSPDDWIELYKASIKR